MDWKYIGDSLQNNKATIVAFTGLLFSSAIKTLPPPGSKFSFYTFFYDWSHQFLNITNTRLNSTPVITPPVSTPESPKGEIK